MMVLDIFLILAGLVLIITCYYVIKALNQITISIKNIETDINDISKKSIPVLENLETATESLSHIIIDIEKKYDEVSDTIIGLKRKVTNFVSDFQYNSYESRGTSIFTTLNAIKKGVSAFWQKLRH